MHNIKIEYSVERNRGTGDWERIYVWMTTNTNYVSGSTSQLDEALRKCKEYREWAKLNDYPCSYRVIKSTITTEVVDE